MIDGFGWFEKQDYRRAFLFFDEVEYLLPRDTVSPLHYPLSVYDSEQYQTTHVALSSDDVGVLIERSMFDARRASLRAVVERLPKRDIRYASLVVRCDAELKQRIPSRAIEDDVFGLVFLANKLLFHAARTGSIPIVGRRYATDILTEKLDAWTKDSAASNALAAATPRGSLSYATFAAGLSLAFIPDDILINLPFETLIAFKEKNRPLMEKHQLHLLDVAETYSSLPPGQELAARLIALRAEAAKQRSLLDDEARGAWRALGVDVAKSSLLAGSTALVSGLAVLRGMTLGDLITAAVPAAIASGGAALAAVVDAAAKIKQARRGTMAYLFEAERTLRDD
jgi:hypothetical protein